MNGAIKAVLYFFTLGGPRTRDQELLCYRAQVCAAWTGIQLLKVIMVMVNSKILLYVVHDTLRKNGTTIGVVHPGKWLYVQELSPLLIHLTHYLV